VIAPAATLQYGLSGSELVRLAALRRVDIEDGRIVVLDKAPTGDALLDGALVNMYRGWREPIARCRPPPTRPTEADTAAVTPTVITDQ